MSLLRTACVFVNYLLQKPICRHKSTHRLTSFNTEYLRNYYILRVCTLSQYWMVTETNWRAIGHMSHWSCWLYQVSCCISLCALFVEPTVGKKLGKKMWGAIGTADTFIFCGWQNSCNSSKHAVVSPLVVDPAGAAITQPPHHHAASTRWCGLPTMTQP